MKGTLNKIREEKGQALIIAVILMLVGGLIIAPLLGFMGTGLKVGQIFEEKIDGLYAADAGIENACWKLKNGDFPACNLTDVNGMDVTVEQIGYEETGGAKLYTLQSTAYLAGELKAEIIAQVKVVVGGAVAEGGEGGEYRTNEETRALSLIDENTIIFTTQNSSKFMGREDTDFGDWIYPCDLWSLNMATGKAHLYLDGDDIGLGTKYKIKGVHYYQEGGSDYLLISVRDNDKVGIDTFKSNDIIRLEVGVAVNTDDPADPYPYISAVNSVKTFDTLGAGIFALSRWDDTGIILFSMHDEDVILGGTRFFRGEVIEFNPTEGTYTSLFNANDIIPEPHPVLEIDCLAVLSESDPRLLISFTVNGVTDSNGEIMNSEDIAIWDPGDPDDPNDDTINLHIGMRGQLVPAKDITTVSIVSWEVSP